MNPAPEITASPAKNRLTYPDLLLLEWIIEDKVDHWKWRDSGLDDLIEKGNAVLDRLRAMIGEDEQMDQSISAQKGGAQ